jgi:hypothetical protein
MKYLLALALLAGCSQAPVGFEEVPGGIRHTTSEAFYPKSVGNYSYLNHDGRTALSWDPQRPLRSSAVYMDYKSGGPMSSLLYRPFARVETYPNKSSFEDFVKKSLKSQTRSARVLEDHTRMDHGHRIRELRLAAEEPFLSYIDGSGIRDKFPSVTKLVYMDKGDYVIFVRTAYPTSDGEFLAKANREFVSSFIKAQF